MAATSEEITKQISTLLKEIKINSKNGNTTKIKQLTATLGDTLNNSSLKRLNLFGIGSEPIEDSGAEALAMALKENSSLENLELVYNHIGDKGALALAATLEINSSLQVLKLHGNEIGNKGVLALLKALDNNFTLQDLDLFRNKIEGREGLSNLDKITSLLTRNQELAEPLLQSNLNALQDLASLKPKNLLTLDKSKYREQYQDYQKKITSSLSVLSKRGEAKSTAKEYASYLELYLKQCRDNLQMFPEPSTLSSQPLVQCENKIIQELSYLLTEEIKPDNAALFYSPEPLPTQSEFSFTVKYQELKMGEPIGRGAFAVVYQGTYRHNHVAIKQLHLTAPSTDALSEFKQEMNTMAKLRCPQIVQLYGFYLNPTYGIVMQYMEKGSLYKVLHSKEPLEWKIRCSIALDITKGIAFLHQEKIIHRDLKSMNVLLNSHLEAKLADFGLAKIKQETTSTIKPTSEAPGTLAWMAPELFKRGNKCTYATDIYSLGMTLWELAARKLPFADAHTPELIPRWVAQGEREEIPHDTPASVSKLITWCWDEEATKRPSAEQAVQQLLLEDVSRSNADISILDYQDNLNSKNNGSKRQKRI